VYPCRGGLCWAALSFGCVPSFENRGGRRRIGGPGQAKCREDDPRRFTCPTIHHDPPRAVAEAERELLQASSQVVPIARAAFQQDRSVL
jgi:hypothetical protein